MSGWEEQIENGEVSDPLEEFDEEELIRMNFEAWQQIEGRNPEKPL